MESRDYAIFEIISPNGNRFLPPQGSSWRFNHDKIEELIADKRIWFGEDGNSRPRLKRFLSDVRNSVPAQTIWKYSDVGHSDSAKKDLQSIMSGAGRNGRSGLQRQGNGRGGNPDPSYSKRKDWTA
jgi:adenine-specific DNA-methyltransferase